MNKKILITGGAGFIGSHLAEKLLVKGEEVFILDNLSTGRAENLQHLKSNKKLHFTKGDVRDEKKLKKLIKKADQIYHLAASVGVKTVIDQPLESFLNNVDGTEAVLRAAKIYGKPVLYTSSSEVYGKSDKLPFKEQSDRLYGSAYSDRWGYALSKAADEFLALAYFREKRLPVVIVRLFNIIGPRQSEAYGMVVPRFIQQALKKEAITIYGDGYQTRCFADVDDAVEALIKLASHSQAQGEIFNLGSEEEITIKKLATTIKRLTGSPSRIKYLPYAKVYGSYFEDMRRRKPDISKIKSLIGYRPRFKLEDSLKKIIDYYKERIAK